MDEKIKLTGGALMNYMGIDHHKQYSHITLVDEEGKAIKSGRLDNLRIALVSAVTMERSSKKGIIG